MSGLFATFNIVKRGMMAHQTALQVVSHNIANADTDGYSVERADLKATEPFGMPSLDSAGTVGQLGTGVEVSSITRSRDIFLDSQIRREQSTINKYSVREEYLSEVETIFNEPSKTGLSTDLSKYWDAWNQFATSPESPTARQLVVDSGDELATSIRDTYSKLSDMEVNAGDMIKNEVFDTNSILEKIKDLDKQIKAVAVSGLQPNDLLDKRDQLLDSLSEKFSFETTQTDFQGIEVSPKVEGSDPGSILKDGSVNYNIDYISGCSISSDNKYLNLNLILQGDEDNVRTVSLDLTNDKDLIDKIAYVQQDASGNWSVTGLKTQTVFSTYNNLTDPPSWTKINGPAQFKDGSINGYESVKTDIEDYKSRLNKLARALAVTVNTIHSNNSNGGQIAANTSMNFFVTTDENNTYITDPTKQVNTISDLEVNDDEPAKDIQVNKRFVDDVSALDAGKISDTSGTSTSGKGNGERASLIGSLRNLRINIQGITRESFLKDNFSITVPITRTDADDLTKVTTKTADDGFTIDSYFDEAISKLGVDSKQTQNVVTNQNALLSQLKTRRESISGVSLDEEMTNMIQFQRSYQANAKMVSVIDELLDTVVNGLIK